MSIRKILVPIDLSENSRKAVDYALRLGQAENAEVTVCYVVDSRDLMGFGREVEEFTIHPTRELQKKYENVLKTFLEGRIPRVNLHGRVEIGLPQKSVLKYAGREKPDLIILGIDGDGKPGPVSSDGIAEVVANAGCPVLLIGPRASPYGYRDAEIEQTRADSARVVQRQGRY